MKKYINLAPLRETGAILQMVLTDRGDGKTTALQCDALRGYHEHGKAAVFCRRYSTEMTQGFYESFAENITKAAPELMKGHTYEWKGVQRAKAARMLYEDGKPAILCVPLSMAGKLKSSLTYERYRDIYIDEYIPLMARDYIHCEGGEVELILELYKTIDRDHCENRVTIAGNKITRFNPVFDYFRVEKWKRGVNLFQEGQFALLVYSYARNAQEAAQSPFGALVRGTRYEGYNEGEFLAPPSELVRTGERHFRVPLFQLLSRTAIYTVYQRADGVIICPAQERLKGVYAAAIESQPFDKTAVWIFDERGQGYREILQRYKYTNALFFASDMVMNDLLKFYGRL